MSRDEPGKYTHGEVPGNVRLGARTVITGDHFSGAVAFKRVKSTRDPAIVVGRDCLLEGVLFNLGTEAVVTIGDGCRFQDCFLIAEAGITIGNRVTIGFHATVVDSDFHPLAAEARLADTVALAPGNAGKAARPAYVSKPIVIEEDAWVGPNATILKGVRIGKGAIVEPGAVVTRDVAAGTRVLGNPAQVMGGEG